MARLTDHDQRDAEHALRAEISLVLMRYARRMMVQGKAYITEEVANATKNGEELDGTTIGRTAAAKVRAEYFATSSKPEPAIEASPVRQTAQLDIGVADTTVTDGYTTGS
jgi:hypothetical protein